MERLTVKLDDGAWALRRNADESSVMIAVDRLAAYEDTMPLERAQELAQAEKDGRLAVLPPNEPLTLEELREMDGEPVWTVAIDSGVSRWTFVDSECELVRFFATRRGVACEGIARYFKTYGKTWLAYRRKPEESNCNTARPTVSAWAEHFMDRFERLE